MSFKLLEMRGSYEIKKLKERTNLEANFYTFFQYYPFSFELQFCDLRARKPSVLLVVVSWIFTIWLKIGLVFS